jgi:hypothetical protein
MKTTIRGKMGLVGVGIIGAGVLALVLAINQGGQVADAWMRLKPPSEKQKVGGILIKKNEPNQPGIFYLLLEDYLWQDKDKNQPTFVTQVQPVSDNWEKVRDLVGKAVNIEGRPSREGLVIEKIEESEENENIEAKIKNETTNWKPDEITALGLNLKYPNKVIKKKTGIFNGKTTWIWEGVGSEPGDVWGLTIGSDRPWGGDAKLCQEDNWGCREIGKIQVSVAGREYQSPIWVTNSGGRIFQFKLDKIVDQPTVTGYYAHKSEGQLLADILRTIR